MLSKEATAYYNMASRGLCEEAQPAEKPQGGSVPESSARPKLSGKDGAFMDGPFGGKRPE